MHRFPEQGRPLQRRRRGRSALKALPIRQSGRRVPQHWRGLSWFARVVVGALAVAAAVTAAGLVLLWPSGAAPRVPPHLEIAAGIGVPTEAGTVTEIYEDLCGSDSLHRAFAAAPDTPMTFQGRCTLVLVDIGSGPDAGMRTLLEATEGPGAPELAVGDDIRLSRATGPDGRTLYDFEDFARGVPLALWAVAAAIVVCAVGAWKGLRALAGIAVALTVIVGFTLPSLLDGHAPVPVAVVSGSVILFVVLYLAHGVNLRTSAALLGTLTALALAAGLSTLAIATTALTGLSEQDNVTIQAFMGTLSVTGLLLAGFIIGSLGVLNDVTISQASTVFELAAADATMPVRGLFTAAMRVGRDHIASIIYTLVLAYAGGALPLLIIFAVSQRSLTTVLTSDAVAVEVVRALVGAIAVVLAVPLTTVTAALLTRGTATAAITAGAGHHH
ncbi:YibE/F family protein [Tomitella gaofuii]|uniref:YibE/F family protein n=1 Tax=Tomitella gaofuii TaxID=2760083 RepID=UPI0015FE42CA|nr:YibE/F family protein [Tomitella gaofuii]